MALAGHDVSLEGIHRRRTTKRRGGITENCWRQPCAPAVAPIRPGALAGNPVEVNGREGILILEGGGDLQILPSYAVMRLERGQPSQISFFLYLERYLDDMKSYLQRKKKGRITLWLIALQETRATMYNI